MTDQIEDYFLYRGRRYYLAACGAGEPFSPHQLGIRPNMSSTACWRGFHCTYDVKKSRLVVAELRLELVKDEVDYKRIPGPVINGVQPVEKAEGPDDFNNNYLGLNYPVDYHGGLIIGREYGEQFHSDLDWINFWKYREVLELRFEGGFLSGIRDISSLMLPIQQFADKQSAQLQTFMDQLSTAMREAPDEETRKVVKQRMIASWREGEHDMETDDFARCQLDGKLESIYLKK